MAAGQPVIPGIPPGAQQGQGPTGFPVGQPGFIAPPAPEPNPVINPELAPPDPEALTIDPLVLHGDVKISVKGSDRMRTRQNLQQAVPFIGQIIMNGPVLEQLAQMNTTADFADFARMVIDATGLQNEYRIFRPLTPQEQQKRDQPSPDAQLKAQQAQQEQQTRTQLMQMKVQGEQAVAEINAAVKNKQITEESARHILGLLQQEQSDQMTKPDPREKMMELQIKAQEHGMNLQHQQQKHQLDMVQTLQKHKLDMAKSQQEHQLGIQQQQQQSQSDALAQRNKLVMDHIASKQKLRQSEEAHKKKVSLMRATPKPTAKK